MGGAGGMAVDAGTGTQRCVNSLDCAMNTDGRTICDTPGGQCVECLLATDCDGTADCVNRACVPYAPCVSSVDCASNPDGKTICDTGVERCVECLTDPDCMMGELCVERTCRPGCDSDNDCTPLGLLCYQTGGYCVQCLREQDCEPNEDCVLGSCTPAPPTPGDGGLAPGCQDGVQNGSETDVDCGGPSCRPCAEGETCTVDDDCQSGTCTSGACEAPACTPMTCPSCFPYTRCCNAMGACSCNIGLGCL
jgi:hypothetical protein